MPRLKKQIASKVRDVNLFSMAFFDVPWAFRCLSMALFMVFDCRLLLLKARNGALRSIVRGDRGCHQHLFRDGVAWLANQALSGLRGLKKQPKTIHKEPRTIKKTSKNSQKQSKHSQKLPETAENHPETNKNLQDPTGLGPEPQPYRSSGRLWCLG